MILATAGQTPERYDWTGHGSRYLVGRMEETRRRVVSPPRPSTAGEFARLLDPDTPVPGVTEGELRPELAAIAVPTTTDGRQMTGEDFALTAGWGHFGFGQAVMPGQGRAVERSYSSAEREALGDAVQAVGKSTFDIHLNAVANWRNVPAAVWHYRLGGYQVLKKWLSYRERQVLGRSLEAHEVQLFAEVARRLAAMITSAIRPNVRTRRN